MHLSDFNHHTTESTQHWPETYERLRAEESVAHSGFHAFTCLTAGRPYCKTTRPFPMESPWPPGLNPPSRSCPLPSNGSPVNLMPPDNIPSRGCHSASFYRSRSITPARYGSTSSRRNRAL